MNSVNKSVSLILILVMVSSLNLLMVKSSIAETPNTSIQESSGLAGFTVLVSSDTDLGGSFGIMIFAIDSSGNSVKSFTGNVTFSASNGVITPASSGAFSQGFWKGILNVSGINAAANYVEIFVYVNDGNGHTGRSGYLHVLPLLPSPSLTLSPTPTSTVPEFSFIIVLVITLVVLSLAISVFKRPSFNIKLTILVYP